MNHTAAQLAQLQRQASAAPKGRWRLSDGGTSVTAHDGRIAAGLPQPLAAYLVAAQPRRMWALIDEIKHLRRALRRAQSTTTNHAIGKDDMTTRTSIKLSELPDIGAPLDDGTFVGVITQQDGTHTAVVLLPAQGSNMEHGRAVAWAEEQNGQLPTRPIAALLFANAKKLLRGEWHWTADTDGASYAWNCSFDYGLQYSGRKSYAGGAVAVRCIPLIP